MASPASGRGQLDYDDLVATYATAADRVCRDWLERAVAERLERPGCRYLLVVAEPGAGKTGLLASLASAHPDWLRYFIRRDSTTPLSGGDAASMLLRLGHQFAARRPALFAPDRLEVVVRQRVQQIGPEASVVGVRVEDLRVSPFHRTAIQVDLVTHRPPATCGRPRHGRPPSGVAEVRRSAGARRSAAGSRDRRRALAAVTAVPRRRSPAGPAGHGRPPSRGPRRAPVRGGAPVRGRLP